MEQSKETIAITSGKLLRLEELAHELSNSNGLIESYVMGMARGLFDLNDDHLTRVLSMASRGREALMSLMWEIGEIRISTHEQGNQKRNPSR